MEKGSLNKLLDCLHEHMGTDSEIKDGCIFCPEFNLTVKPEILSDGQNDTRVNFRLSAPDWDDPLVDKRMAPNIEVACNFFLKCYWDGVRNMLKGIGAASAESSYNGKTHKWKIYSGEILNVGEDNVAGTQSETYLDLLKDGIIKRLGNRKVYTVKVFITKSKVQTFAECLVNGVRSEELSKIAAGSVGRWQIKNFYSQEQSFFIMQDKETILPYRYSGEKGRAEIREKVKTAMEIFHKRAGTGDYESYIDDLKDAIGDTVLAWECYLFIPEICAANNYYKIPIPESFLLNGGQSPVYTAQLADYSVIRESVFSVLDSGYFKDETDDVYGEYIEFSSFAKAVHSMASQGLSVSGVSGMAMAYSVEPNVEFN